MGEAVTGETRAVIDEITRALEDDVGLGSRAWWQYVTVLSELGPESARKLVAEVRAVEAKGGMTTKDGSRRRTPGGVFFALAYEQLGPKRTKAVRSRADRRFQEEMLGKFLELLALVVPSTPDRPAVTATAGAPAAPPAPKPAPPPREAPAKASAAKPARKPEPEAVEVMVVRRRPAASTPAKSGPSNPRPGR